MNSDTIATLQARVIGMEEQLCAAKIEAINLRATVRELEGEVEDLRQALEDAQKPRGYATLLSRAVAAERALADAEARVAKLEAWKRVAAEHVEQASQCSIREKMIEAYARKLESAFEVPSVWPNEERDGLAKAFDDASRKHGHYETLFAVAAWILRHRRDKANG